MKISMKTLIILLMWTLVLSSCSFGPEKIDDVKSTTETKVDTVTWTGEEWKVEATTWWAETGIDVKLEWSIWWSKIEVHWKQTEKSDDVKKEEWEVKTEGEVKADTSLSTWTNVSDEEEDADVKEISDMLNNILEEE